MKMFQYPCSHKAKVIHPAGKLFAFVVTLAMLSGIFPRPVSAEDISSSGWRLWPDREAAWKTDTLYLPAEVKLDRMPVNPPTGGWQALNGQQGIPVTLPSTVEEHYWGKFGTRPYTKNEAQRGAGTSFPNGNYLGVSWWWRQVQIPNFKQGQRIVVSFRGARLRAEVYCNGKLCGYTIMTELPFTADLTDAVKPGQTAQIAIRITNPGGHLDWIDFAQMIIRWGKYTLPPSHGFGGLDNDIQLAVRDNVSVSDLAAINKPDLHQVHLVAEVSSVTKKYQGRVHFSISKDGKAVWNADKDISLAAGEKKQVEVDAQVDSALPWDIQHPNLYQASASLKGLPTSDRQVNFGFRFFNAEGIGSDDAKLVLNGKRIVLISSISWGYWGRNGLWPDQEMAEREVSDAKALGLNCLHFHRNIGKPAVLDVQDREGLLRYEEPGAGKFIVGARHSIGPFGTNDDFLGENEKLLDALKPMKDYVQPETVDTSGTGPDAEARAFWEKYEEEKILEMVRRDRSHPSLIIYDIQNESSDLDLRNPRIYRIFRLMHALDPSRIITFYSGGVPKDCQVLMLPYGDEIHYGSKTIPFAGWHDVHTCGGPCNYLDNLYTSPTNFFQRQNEADHKEIGVWGEALGAAAPDDYDKLVHSFDAGHPTGYELADMTKTLDGYHEFLDKWGFRKAFPTDSSLFQAIGYREYYFWQRIVGQTRADNANDELVISGWESTTIDNHSGLVDNHRFFKGDPAVIAKACQPEMLFLQPRHMIVAKGDIDLVDVFLLNETNRTGPQTLKFTAKRPAGSIAFNIEKPVVAVGGDTYGQLLAEGIQVPTDAAGILTIEATLTARDSAASPLNGDDQIEVIDVAGAPVYQNIAVCESGNEISNVLMDVFHVAPVTLSSVPGATRLDAIILSTKSMRKELMKPGDSTNSPPRTGDRGLGPQISEADFDAALNRVKNDGTRLILWPDNNVSSDVFAKALAARHIVNYSGVAGNLNAPWFGSWNFVRQHWLLAGLPADCAMDWRYGISAFNGPSWLHENPRGTETEGLMLDAPGMEVAIGYGADHNPKIGISGCVIPYGSGQIVLYCLPQLVRSLQPGDFAINRMVCQRLLANALQSK
jgi:beta-galactosidase